jgi:hypothetical protein
MDYKHVFEMQEFESKEVGMSYVNSVAAIHGKDMEALKLFSKIMKKQYVRNNVLDVLCHYLCGSNSIKRKRVETEVLTIPFRNP